MPLVVPLLVANKFAGCIPGPALGKHLEIVPTLFRDPVNNGSVPCIAVPPFAENACATFVLCPLRRHQRAPRVRIHEKVLGPDSGIPQGDIV